MHICIYTIKRKSDDNSSTTMFLMCNSLALSHGTKSDVLQQGMTTLHFQTKWNK